MIFFPFPGCTPVHVYLSNSFMESRPLVAEAILGIAVVLTETYHTFPKPYVIH